MDEIYRELYELISEVHPEMPEANIHITSTEFMIEKREEYFGLSAIDFILLSDDHIEIVLNTIKKQRYGEVMGV
jgi:hypothetical protein